MALPWLESLAKAGTSVLPPQRTAFYYVPIGVVRQTFFPGEEKNIVQQKFTNENYDAESTRSNIKVGLYDLQLTQTMKPLSGLKDKVTLITGLDRTFQPGTDVHAQCASCFLSSASPFSLKHTPYPRHGRLIISLRIKSVRRHLLKPWSSAVTVTRIIRNRFSLIIFPGMELSMLLHRCVIRYLLTADCLNPMRVVPIKISPIWC